MKGTESREPDTGLAGGSAPPGEARAISLELLGAFLALMPDAAVVVDADGSIVGANEQAEALFGYPPGDLAGLVIEALVPERARHRHRQHRASYLRSAEKRPMGAGLQLTGRRQDGHEFPLDISLAPITIANEQFVVAGVRDMTEQRAQAAAQAQLATIVETSSDAIFSMTVEGHITRWNPGAEALLGYSRDGIVGQHVAALVPARESVVLEELLDRAAHEAQGGVQDTRWLRRDGTEVDVAVSISPMRDRGGSLLGFSAVARDVSERKAAEAEQRRLYAEQRRLERQHEATAEIRLALLAGSPLNEVLRLICARSAELVEAPVAVICLRNDETLQLVAAVGSAEPMIGSHVEVEGSFVGEVVRRGEVVASPRRSARSRVTVPLDMPDGPTLGVPIVAGGVVSGSLSFVRAVGGEEFGQADRIFGEALAAQAALALELDRARASQEEMMLLGDRERIARDLHDLVIQRLYAAGMRLQATVPLTDRPIVQERLAETVSSLDETIREIRNTIFAITRSRADDGQLRGQILAIAEAARGSLGFAPHVAFEGPVDAAVTDHVIAHAVAVVHEAISNTARHARATSLDIFAAIVDGLRLRIEVTDNGIGIARPVRSSGLANLEERARLLGGTFEATSPRSGGTRIVWEVPIG